MTIQSWKKPFGRHGLYSNIPALYWFTIRIERVQNGTYITHSYHTEL